MTKEGMRGFAGGLLIASAIFAFFYYQVFHIPTRSITTAKLTNDTVQGYLSKHQLVAVNKDEYANLKALQKQNQQNKSGQTNDSATTSQQSSGNNTSKNQANSASKVYKADIEIKSGMTSQDVADLLKKNHIINDVHKFNNYLQGHKLMRYVQIGTFHVTSDMSISELAKVITKS